MAFNTVQKRLRTMKKYLFSALIISTFISSSGFAKTILLSMNANTNRLRFTTEDNKKITDAFKKIYNNKITIHQIINVTRDKYKQAIKKIRKEIKPHDNLIIYFSGHGTTVYDTSGDESDGYDEALVGYYKASHKVNIHDLITDDELSHDLRQFNLNQHNITLILDTCFSAGMQKSLSMQATNIAVNKYTFISTKKTQRPKNIFTPLEGTSGILDHINGRLFAASSEDQEALEYNTFKGGIFTYFLVKQLNQQRNINQAFRLARLQVIKITNGQQEPKKYIY